MDLNKIIQLAGLVAVVIVALALLRMVMGLAISVVQIALVAAVVGGLFFLVERLFGKG